MCKVIPPTGCTLAVLLLVLLLLLLRQVSDELRRLLLVDDSEHAELYSSEERSTLLFRLFELFCIGGACCQYEVGSCGSSRQCCCWQQCRQRVSPRAAATAYVGLSSSGGGSRSVLCRQACKPLCSMFAGACTTFMHVMKNNA
jgi:hypothetical protein